jgi:hypothetical protein
MGWGFRQRLRILPGVYLNFSRAGVSVSVGAPGYRITVGKDGISETVSIPGTGVYRRRRVSGPLTPAGPTQPTTPPGTPSQSAGSQAAWNKTFSWNAVVIAGGIVLGVGAAVLLR